MTITCPQCGEIAAQATNFCRKCGAPLLVSEFATMPLATPTAPVSAASDEKKDPYDAMEPRPPIVATAALPAAEPKTAAMPSSAQTAVITTTQTTDLPSGAKPALAAPRSRNGLLIGVGSVALLTLLGLVFYFSGRPASPAPTIAITTATPAQTDTTPTPNENNNLATIPPSPELADEKLTAATGKGTPTTNAKPSPTANLAAKVAPAPANGATATYPTPEPTKATPANTTAESYGSLIEQGNRFASAGQFQAALQAYEKAQRANPNNADVHYLIGSAYHRSGDLAHALESYRKCASGNYASVAANHVKNLEKKLGKKN